MWLQLIMFWSLSSYLQYRINNSQKPSKTDPNTSMNQLPLTTHSSFTIIHLFGTHNSTVGREHSITTPNLPCIITVVKYKFDVIFTRWQKDRRGKKNITDLRLEVEPTKKHYFPVSHSTEFTQSLSSALNISPKRHTLACNTPDRSNFFDATGKLYLFICRSQSDASLSWWFLQFVYHWPSQRRQCEIKYF